MVEKLEFFLKVYAKAIVDIKLGLLIMNARREKRELKYFQRLKNCEWWDPKKKQISLLCQRN